MKTRLIFSMLVMFAAVQGAVAAPLAIGKDDTVSTVLTAQKGGRVTVRLASGDELSGKVVELGAGVVQLGELSGREYFDAVIPIEHIQAVIVRVRE